MSTLHRSEHFFDLGSLNGLTLFSQTERKRFVLTLLALAVLCGATLYFNYLDLKDDFPRPRRNMRLDRGDQRTTQQAELYINQPIDSSTISLR